MPNKEKVPLVQGQILSLAATVEYQVELLTNNRIRLKFLRTNDLQSKDQAYSNGDFDFTDEGLLIGRLKKDIPNYFRVSS